MTDTIEMTEGAEKVGNVLLEAMGEWLPEEDIAESTGLSGYQCRWYIFQLRELGWVIEAVKEVDKPAFRQGHRGWKLTDIQDQPSRPAAPRAPRDPRAPRAPRIKKGSAVAHPVHGTGTIAFAKKGFPCVRVEFSTGLVAKVDRSEIRALTD